MVETKFYKNKSDMVIDEYRTYGSEYHSHVSEVRKSIARNKDDTQKNYIEMGNLLK